MKTDKASNSYPDQQRERIWLRKMDGKAQKNNQDPAKWMYKKYL